MSRRSRPEWPLSGVAIVQVRIPSRGTPGRSARLSVASPPDTLRRGCPAGLHGGIARQGVPGRIARQDRPAGRARQGVPGRACPAGSPGKACGAGMDERDSHGRPGGAGRQLTSGSRRPGRRGQRLLPVAAAWHDRAGRPVRDGAQPAPERPPIRARGLAAAGRSDRSRRPDRAVPPRPTGVADPGAGRSDGCLAVWLPARNGRRDGGRCGRATGHRHHSGDLRGRACRQFRLLRLTRT